MLFYDVTKISGYRHHSGLARTSQHLRRRMLDRLGADYLEVTWSKRRAAFVDAERQQPVNCRSEDWLLTVELFSENERPGFTAWLENRTCRAAALFYDAIPLRHPEFTWPHSVARHPAYMKLLAHFDRVLAISQASAGQLRGYWRWLGVTACDPEAIVLGADGWNMPRATAPSEWRNRSRVVMLGILEPRKNQTAVLDAAEQLWAEGLAFPLTLVGRVNPHFGRPIAQRVRDLRRRKREVEHVANLGDEALVRLMEQARFLVMPSVAEGCGLPVLESLWAGVPVLCSDIPPLRENAAGGGCMMVSLEKSGELAQAMRELLRDDDRVAHLAREARSRPLPTWDDTVGQLLRKLKGQL